MRKKKDIPQLQNFGREKLESNFVLFFERKKIIIIFIFTNTNLHTRCRAYKIGSLQKPPGLRKIKWLYLRLHTTTHLILTGNIFYSTKNQVRGLCVGVDMVILFFSDPAVFTQTQQNLPHSISFAHPLILGPEKIFKTKKKCKIFERAFWFCIKIKVYFMN